MIIFALILFLLLMCGITPGMIAMGIIAVIALPSQYIIYFILRKAHPENDDIDIWYDKRGNNILIMNSETIIWALLALFVVKITSCAMNIEMSPRSWVVATLLCTILSLGLVFWQSRRSDEYKK